jgi:hypothetical protein
MSVSRSIRSTAEDTGVQVRATPLWNETRPNSQRTAKLELLTTYEPIAKLSRDPLAVLEGTVEEAILEEEVMP